MILNRERRAALLAYCKLEEFAEDLSVQMQLDGMYAAAVGYLLGAGVSQPQEGTLRAAQYDLLVNAMVLDFFDHRDMQESGGQVCQSPAFRQMLTQLKLTEGLVSKLDTPPQEEGEP
nr:MAG TPA: hypothetical protein [Caudoviricetes sp.]